MNYQGYQPYQIPGMCGIGQYQNQLQSQSLIRQEITKVSGRNGAEMYQMAPNSSVLLLDESAPIVWLKTTDGAGYPTLAPYKITPYKQEEPVDVKSLEERVSKIEEALNAKSNLVEIKHDAVVATESGSD